VDANGGEISYTYDQHSNIIAITDALGNTTRYEYDAFGNKVKETAPDGSSYSLQYDASNNLTQLTDQRGGVTRYEYDEHNRLVRQTNPWDRGRLMRVRVTKWLQVSFYPHSSISCAALRHGRSLSHEGNSK